MIVHRLAEKIYMVMAVFKTEEGASAVNVVRES